MSNNSSTTIPGMIYPTRAAMSSGTPASSAMTNMKATAVTQTNATKAMAGGKIKRNGRSYRGGAASGSTIIVPQITPMLYKPVGGPGTGPNDQATNNLINLTQSGTAGNAKYDNYATVMGGYRRRKGGNSDWNWGCMSGGKKKKSRKHTRRNKHKKSRKSRTYRKH